MRKSLLAGLASVGLLLLTGCSTAFGGSPEQLDWNFSRAAVLQVDSQSFACTVSYIAEEKTTVIRISETELPCGWEIVCRGSSSEVTCAGLTETIPRAALPEENVFFAISESLEAASQAGALKKTAANTFTGVTARQKDFTITTDSGGVLQSIQREGSFLLTFFL